MADDLLLVLLSTPTTPTASPASILSLFVLFRLGVAVLFSLAGDNELEDVDDRLALLLVAFVVVVVAATAVDKIGSPVFGNSTSMAGVSFSTSLSDPEINLVHH